MNWSKVLLGTLVGGIVYFLAGWLIYGILLRETLTIPQHMSDVIEYKPEEFKISLMFISNLFMAFMLSFIFSRWAGISTFVGGAKGGAILGILISFWVGLSMASMYKFGNVQNTAIDAVANAICTGLAGGVIGWILGRSTGE